MGGVSDDVLKAREFLGLNSPFRKQQQSTRMGEQYGWQREEELLAAFRAEARLAEHLSRGDDAEKSGGCECSPYDAGCIHRWGNDRER